MANDSFIREVDEELRSDRMREAWRRFGPFVIGGAVAIVLLVAVNEGWDWWQKSTASASSDQFYTALELAENGDTDGALAALDTVKAEGSGSYPTLARFREAALLAKQGKTDESVAAYDAIATEVNDRNLRQLALILAAYRLVDSGDVSGVESRVSGLDTPDNVMRNSAREAIGLVKYRAGDLDGAEAAFEAAVADPQLSQDARNRIQIYLAQLAAEGAGAPPAPEPAAAPDVTSDEPADPPADAASDAAPAATPEAAAPASEAPAVDDAAEPEAAAPAADAPEASPASDDTPATDAAAETEDVPATDEPAPAN